MFIFHISEALPTCQQNSTMALRHSAQARRQEQPSENLVGRAHAHAEYRIQGTSHQGNRPDVTVFDKQAQEILVVEFSCPWVTNRIKKDEEKAAKYQQVREELNPQTTKLFTVTN